MPAVRLNPMLRVMWKLHRLVLRASGGRIGSRMGSMQVLQLETIGHKSGQPRTVGLSHLEDGGKYFVIASYAGEDRDPAWATNLKAQPRAIVTIGGRRVPVRACVLEGAEREAKFDRFLEVEAAYGEYRERTTRVIPVFELRPEGS